MHISPFNQRRRFRHHLRRLRERPVLPYDRAELLHKVHERTMPTQADAPAAFHADVLFRFDLYPPALVQAYPQWVDEGRAPRPGDTIVEQIRLPPVPAGAQYIIVGVRISELVDEPGYKRLAYETLDGHLERGIGICTLERTGGGVNLRLDTYANLNGLLLQAAEGLASTYQSFALQAAIRRLAGHLRRENPDHFGLQEQPLWKQWSEEVKQWQEPEAVVRQKLREWGVLTPEANGTAGGQNAAGH